MSEKFYVVSESELAVLVGVAQDYESDDNFADELTQAKAACRARPVPDWATHFYKGELNEDKNIVRTFEEIKK